MKKIILALVVLLGLGTYANAQETSKYWVGGSIGFTATDDGSDTYTNYNVVPEFGFTLSDRLGLGMKLGYQHVESGNAMLLNEVIELDGNDVNIFSVNPFLRIACLKGNLGGLFVDGGVSYAYAKIKDIYVSDYFGGDRMNVKMNIFEVGFRPGVSLNVSNRVSLLGRFGFLGWQQVNVDGGSKVNNYGLDFNLNQIQLGMNLAF